MNFISRLLFAIPGITLVVGFLMPVASSAYPLPPLRPAILPIEGLSQNSVYAIHRDSRGYYWFGTADGLNRYDGYHIKVYRSHASDPTSLTHSSIRSIAEDHDGNIWVGCDLGVNRFDRRTGKFSRHLDFAHDSARIWSIGFGEDDADNFWVVGSIGLYRYDKARDMMVPLQGFSLPPGVAIQDARFDRHGGIWLATTEGIRYVDSKGPSGHGNILKGSEGRIVKALCLLKDGTVVAGLEGEGVYRFGQKDGSVMQLTRNTTISVLQQDSLGHVWIGTRSEGVVVIDSAGNIIERFPPVMPDAPGLPSPIVRSLCFDSTGIVFVGTDGGGVAKIDPHATRFPLLRHDLKDPNSLSGNFIKAIFEDKVGNLWVGTSGAGLSRFERSTHTWKTFGHYPEHTASLGGTTIKAVNQDGTGVIWVVTDSSLEWLDPVRNVSISVHYPLENLFPPGNVFVNALYADSSGSMWLATNAGLEEYDIRARVFRYHKLRNLGWPNTVSLTGIYGKHGELYIALGTQVAGVVIVDPRVDTCLEFESSSPLPARMTNNTVKSLCWSSKRLLWAGTEDGLNCIDVDSRTVRSFGEENGFANSYIYGVLEAASGNIWCSTNKGLVEYAPLTGRVRNFDTDDGLQAMEFNTGAYCRDREGHLCFGGINGVNIFDPQRLSDNPHPPLVRIMGVRTDKRPLADEEDIVNTPSVTISYTDRSFEIDYMGIEYSDPLKVQYLYRLDGVESEWVNAGESRIARYTTLNPGEYTFHVLAANGDGVWSPVGASLRIVIVPPFWRTIWFMILAVVVLLGAVILTVRLVTLRAVRRRLEEAERRNALERERSRIAKDMHDEVGASLTRIALLSDSVHRQSGVPDGASKQMERISTAARDVIENMSEIIWAMNPGNDTLDNLMAYMRQYIVESCEVAGLEYIMAIDEPLPTLKVSSEFRRNVFLAVKEALHNSVKHANAEKVVFTVHIEELKTIEIALSDDGAGFEPGSTGPFGNGLRNMPKRIEEIHGSFAILSEPGKGTRVVVRVPITTFM